MNRDVKINAGILSLVCLIVFAAVNAQTGSKTELEKAYVKGTVSLQEVVAKTDSMFSLINEMYQPVKPILERSCFDCHSNTTCYPWYHKLPLIEGMIDGHIEEGRKHLDMSDDFPFSGKEHSLELLADIREEVEQDNMPIFSYRMLHWGKLIEGESRDSLFGWIDTTTIMLTDFYEGLVPAEPEDSL